MKIQNEQFGEIEYSPENVINFKAGILGFEDFRQFLLLKSDNEFFFWLNSIEKPDLSFPMVGIRMIDESYPEEHEYEAFGIVNLNKDPLKVTVNLKAPVYIDQNEKSGYQRIIDDSKYPIDYKLFVE